MVHVASFVITLILVADVAAARQDASNVRLQSTRPQSTSWRDPSPHIVRFVDAEKDVPLEVLDWGGAGRPVVLLAGGGNTAHVFDEFATKLTAVAHVYGVTRRGFGASGFSTTVAAGSRLGEDVLAVLDALKLTRPVLAGHSIAGAELSWIATSHPDRIAGVVYLDAAYPYAFDNGAGATMKEFLDARAPQRPDPRDSDLASFTTLQKWNARDFGYTTPEAEFRHSWDSTADGRPAKVHDAPGAAVFMAIMSATKKYTAIPVPALAIFAIPHVAEAWMTSSADPAVRNAGKAYYATIDALAEKQAKAFEAAVPTARVVRLRGSHHIFLSNEADVLREMRGFLGTLQ